MTNPARFDLRGLIGIQKDLHEPVLGEKGEWRIDTPFASLFTPTLRNASTRVALTRVASNKSSVDYILDANVDYILYTYLEQEIPALKVRPEHQDTVRIAWTNYLGFNLFRMASLKYGDLQPTTLCPMAMYCWMLFLIQQKRLQALLLQIGHTNDLITWGSSLPEARLYVPLPHYYASHFSLALPYFALADKKALVHQFDLTPLRGLLRMQRLVEDKWTDVPCDLKYLELPQDFSGRLPLPELWARTITVEEDERKAFRCEPEHVVFYDTFKVIESTQETEEGREGTLSLDCEAPCKAFMFGCINTQSLKLNQHQNWLREDDTRPMETYKVLYGNSERVPETPLDHLDIDMWELLPPNFPPAGLAVHLTDVAPVSLTASSGVVYTPELKAHLAVKLKDPEPDTPRTTYKIQALLWTTQKLVFTRDSKNELAYNLAVYPDPIDNTPR